MNRNNLKLFRISKKLTQEQLAEKLGVTIVTYNQIEKGNRSGSMSFWSNLQQAYEVPDSELWQLTKLTK